MPNQVKSFEDTYVPLLFDSKHHREYRQLFTQWAPILVGAFELKNFALGRSPSVYHSAAVTSCYPAEARFGFVFVAHPLTAEESAPANINVLRGSRAWMPTGHVVQITSSKVYMKDVLARNPRNNDRAVRTSLTGISEIMLTCNVYRPKGDYPIALIQDNRDILMLR